MHIFPLTEIVGGLPRPKWNTPTVSTYDDDGTSNIIDYLAIKFSVGLLGKSIPIAIDS